MSFYFHFCSGLYRQMLGSGLPWTLIRIFFILFKLSLNIGLWRERQALLCRVYLFSKLPNYCKLFSDSLTLLWCVELIHRDLPFTGSCFAVQMKEVSYVQVPQLPYELQTSTINVFNFYCLKVLFLIFLELCKYQVKI